MSWRRNSAFLLALGMGAAGAAGDDALVISALRNPVDKSYRKMVRGMELFEEMRALAPAAALRYRLLPRKRDTDMRDIALHVVGRSFDAPLVVAADGTFTLARDEKALRENAVVRSERRAQSMTWRAEVRTPGLAPDTRRLGDLRLECLVGMEAELVSRYPSLLGRLFDLLEDPRSFCGRDEVPYLFFAERPLFGVTLVSGTRRETLPVRKLWLGLAAGRPLKEDLRHCDCQVLLERAYVLPLGERSWPDDTSVELEYMDAPGESALGGYTKADVAAVFGQPRAARFDSGYEVWSYEFGGELVVLFGPSGSVTKTRQRPPR